MKKKRENEALVPSRSVSDIARQIGCIFCGDVGKSTRRTILAKGMRTNRLIPDCVSDCMLKRDRMLSASPTMLVLLVPRGIVEHYQSYE